MQKTRCEMCADSKWKGACPECDGTGYMRPEKIKYWWSEDRQWFCIETNDGVNRSTVSLSVEEAEALMAEVQQTPAFLALQERAWKQAQALMEKAKTGDGPSVSNGD